jgi:hypothetical protein
MKPGDLVEFTFIIDGIETPGIAVVHHAVTEDDRRYSDWTVDNCSWWFYFPLDAHGRTGIWPIQRELTVKMLEES